MNTGRALRITLAVFFAHALACTAVRALDYDEKRLLPGIAKIEVKRVDGSEDIGSAIIVQVLGSTIHLVTALHVLAGNRQERENSDWQRHPKDIQIAVRFFGETTSYPGRMFEQWDEDLDLAVVEVVHPQMASASVAVTFALASPKTLGAPFSVLAIGNGGSADWKLLRGKVTAVSESDVEFVAAGVAPGDSGGALIDRTRNALIGMMRATSDLGSHALPSDVIVAKLEQWRIAHHLRQVNVSTPMVYIPAGYFKMGGGTGGGISGSSRDIYLDDYFIDKYEVTVAEFRHFVKATGYDYTAELPTANYARDDREDFPMNCVSWNDAAAYAEWAGKQLPTEAQWEKAARGPDGNKYPWGKEAPAPGDAALALDWPVAVGSHVRDRSTYGAFDMLGNVSEWVHDWYSPYYLKEAVEKNPQGPAGAGVDHVLRGASHQTPLNTANLSDRRRNLPGAGRQRFDYGFRCVLNEK